MSWAETPHARPHDAVFAHGRKGPTRNGTVGMTPRNPQVAAMWSRRARPGSYLDRSPGHIWAARRGSPGRHGGSRRERKGRSSCHFAATRSAPRMAGVASAPRSP